MPAPDYLICLECETPCYTFEWSDDKIVEIQCIRCGNEDPVQFLTDEEFEALSEDRGPRSRRER
jgi:translation initiation factor 2 beta subunit (eIF-2beta)/eIF-5